MGRLQSQLHDLPFFDGDFARDWEELFDNPVDARLGKGRISKQPASAPCQEVVGSVRQQHQGLLGRQPLLAPPGQLQTAFIGLQLGLDHRAVVIGLSQRRQ